MLFLKSMRLLSPLVMCSAAFATSFGGGPAGPSFGSNCSIGVSASLLGGGSSPTTNGMTTGGSALNASAAVNLGGLNACSLTWTSTRVMADAAGQYSMSSSLSGQELAGVNLALLGGATLSVDTYLQSQPLLVATASYTFPLLTLLNSVNVSSGSVPVTTSGTDTLTQVVRLQFGGSALPILAALNPTLLTSPSFASSITAVNSAVPEPGTTLMAALGLGLLAISKMRIQKSTK